MVQAAAGRSRLEWEDLRIFLAVAERGSFSAAARSLDVEQSTVSRRIAQLETTLEVALFERLASGARITPFGEKVLVRAHAMAHEVQGLEDDLSHHEREVRGEVRLALTESIAVHAVLPFVLPALFEKHPALRVALLASYEVADLGHRDAELALRFFRPTSGDLVTQCVAKMPTIWMGHERWFGVSREALEFVGVQIEGVPSIENDVLRRALGKPPRLVVGSYVAQIEALRAGLGAALVAESALGVDPKLVALDIGLPPGPVLELWLVAPTSLRHVPRVAAVWSALEEGLGFLANQGRPGVARR